MTPTTRFVHGLLVCIGLLVGPTGCTQTPAPAAETENVQTDNAVPSDKIWPRDHDEPIVVDNGPVRVRLGRNPKPSGDPNQPPFGWERDFTAFGYLLVILRENNGEIVGTPWVKELCEGCDIQLELVSVGSGSDQSTVTFDANLTMGSLVMRTGTRKFNEVANSGGNWYVPALMEQHGGPPMRVRYVKGLDVNGDPLNIPEFTDQNKKVEVVITGRAH